MNKSWRCSKINHIPPLNFTAWVVILLYIVKTLWQHSEECMCRLRNIAMRDYQESVTTGQFDGWTDEQTDAGQK